MLSQKIRYAVVYYFLVLFEKDFFIYLFLFMAIFYKQDSLNSLIDFIIEIYHAPVRHNINGIEREALELIHASSEIYEEFKKMAPLFESFKEEMLEHMNREENEFFPVLRHIEDTVLWKRGFTDCDLKKFEDVIHLLEFEHTHFNNYLELFLKIFRESDLKNKNQFVYDHFHNYFSMLENETMRHTQIENEILHPLAKKLFKQVCELT